MKKVNFKKVMMALLTVFALTFGVQETQAQSSLIETGADLYDPAQGTFLGSDEAKDILEDELPVYKAYLGANTPGTPAYESHLKTFIYYYGIYQELEVGKTVSAAIGEGLAALNDTNGFGELERTELEDLRDGAIDLLQ